MKQQPQVTETVAFKTDGTVKKLRRRNGKTVETRTKTPNFYKNRKGEARRLELSSVVDGNGGPVVDDDFGAE